MCGITGIINYKRNLLNETNKVYNMTDALIHRGPDEFDFYYNDNALLGHRRLIVIDPVGGKQPMTFKNQYYEYTIVYNGEIYNTDEVRKQLTKRGCVFESHCDTEVVLKAYVEWGEDCVQYLNGIFAFGIWESFSKTLFLARDRVGVKPLFYADNGDYFLFGSEIKALLKSGLVEPIFDEQSLLELFSLGPSRVLGSGLFKGVYELKPAEFMYITPNKRFNKIYWKPMTNDHVENKSSTIERLSYLVKDAIEKQLVSDVPICTFLSGGLDSSGISSIASEYLASKGLPCLDTYSIDYEDNNHYYKTDEFQPSDDNLWVKRVSSYIKSNHHRIEIDIDNLTTALLEATKANDYPGMADIDSSLLLFCGEIKKNHTVALSGECADEIFGGYPWFRNEQDIYYEGFPWNRHIDTRQSFLAKEISHLKLKDFAYAEYKKTIKDIDYLEYESKYDKGIRRLTYLNYKWFMVTLLTRKDRMSMHNSLEVRVPFADHRIIEYTYNIPWSLKYMNNIEKGLLRVALKDYLPHDVINRKKSPYPKTYHPKYTKVICETFKEMINSGNAPIRSLININKVNNIIDEDINLFKTPWFGQLMKGPQFLAYLIQLNYFLDIYNVRIEGV